MKNKYLLYGCVAIFIILGVIYLTSLIKHDDKNVVNIFSVGDLKFIFNKEFVKQSWYDEGELLSIDFSLPNLTAYRKKTHNKHKVRVFIQKIYPNEPTLAERIINRTNSFGAILNSESTYDDLQYYSTRTEHSYEYFSSKYKDIPLIVSCHKPHPTYSPQCNFENILLSSQVKVNYFYPRTFLHDWKNIHLKIKSIVKNSIKKDR